MGAALGGSRVIGHVPGEHSRVTFLLTDAATAREVSDGQTLAPTELLSVAGAVRSDERLRQLGLDRFGILDRGLERLGEAAAADRVGPLVRRRSSWRAGAMARVAWRT